MPEIGRELKRRDKKRTMKHFLVWVILLSMPLRSPLAAQPPRQGSAPEITKHPADPDRARLVQAAQVPLINDVQIKLAEIPAPSYQEEERAAAVEALLGAAGLTTHRDKMGNIIGEFAAQTRKKL